MDEKSRPTKRKRFSSPEEAKEALLKRLAKRQFAPADHPIFSMGFLTGGVIIAGRSNKTTKSEDTDQQEDKK